jgi:hypothetical protein
VSVGPSGFTAAGLVHLGNVLVPKVLPAGFIDTQDGIALLKLILDLAVCACGDSAYGSLSCPSGLTGKFFGREIQSIRFNST